MERPIRRSGSPVGRGRGRPGRQIQRTRPSPGRTIRYSTSMGSPAAADSLDGSPDEVPVVRMDRRLEDAPGDDLVRRVAEDRPSPLGDPEDARAVVERPEPRLGGVRGQAQALPRSPAGLSSWRLRASALVKTCATSCSRFTRASGQSRSARRVFQPSAPTGGSPPTVSGRHRFDLTPHEAAALAVDARPPAGAPPATTWRPRGRPASAAGSRGTAPDAAAREEGRLSPAG